MYVLPGGHETGTVRQGKNVCMSPCWPLSTPHHSQLAKPTIPQRRASNQRERAECGRKEASPLLVHPLTSICAITPYDTWFHVTRWPTGWTTKTRNKGSRYKWPPSGLFFHPLDEGKKRTERGADRDRFNGVTFLYLHTVWRHSSRVGHRLSKKGIDMFRALYLIMMDLG